MNQSSCLSGDKNCEIGNSLCYKCRGNINVFSKKTNKEKEIPEGLKGKGDLSNKALFSSIDPRLLHEIGIGFRKGSEKHGLNNFRKMDLTAAQGVWDSLNRHVNDYARGIAIDPETGVSNLALIVTNVSMLSRLAYNYGHDKVIEAISCGDIKIK